MWIFFLNYIRKKDKPTGDFEYACVLFQNIANSNYIYDTLK